MLTRIWYAKSAPTGQMTVAARQKATALPAPLPRAWPKSLMCFSPVNIERCRADVTITRQSVIV